MQNSASKNVLQEYYQKRKLSLPKYVTSRVGGTDNDPQWLSIVTLHDGTKYTGNVCSKLKTSEFSVASIALADIHKSTKIAINKKEEICEEIDDIVLFKANKRAVLIVDLENLHKILDLITDRELNDNDLTIYAFVREHHDLVDKSFTKEIIKVVSPSTCPDGTDTCIQIHIGIFLSNDLYDNYFIATRAKFGSNLVDMIISNKFGWKNKQAKVVTKLSQMYEF